MLKDNEEDKNNNGGIKPMPDDSFLDESLIVPIQIKVSMKGLSTAFTHLVVNKNLKSEEAKRFLGYEACLQNSYGINCLLYPITIQLVDIADSKDDIIDLLDVFYSFFSCHALSKEVDIESKQILKALIKAKLLYPLAEIIKNPLQLLEFLPDNISKMSEPEDCCIMKSIKTSFSDSGEPEEYESREFNKTLASFVFPKINQTDEEAILSNHDDEITPPPDIQKELDEAFPIQEELDDEIDESLDSGKEKK